MKKFKYFWITYNNNIFKDYVLYHLNKNHDIINLEFRKLETINKINSIVKKLDEIKTKNELK